MGNMMKSGAALLGLGVLWTTVALGGKDATSSEPSVNERLAATVRIEISAPGGQRWLPTYVLRDRAQVRALTTALAKHPLYQGDPAGWIHEVEIKFYPARGEPLIAYTHSSEVLGHSDSFLSYQGGGERLLSKAMARQLIPFVKRAEAMKAKEPVNLSGTWEGQVLFTSGARARVSLELKAAPEGGLVGSYTLREQGEHGLGKPQTAKVKASLEDTTLSLRLPGGRTFRAELGDAGSHAERALYGSFRDPGREGVFVLWRYRK